jgi:hypothetical protein
MSAETKTRPVLFKGEMVRGILKRRKTHTRRIFKLPRGTTWYEELGGQDEGWFTDGKGWWNVEEMSCPYGKPGDQLWVRETWARSRNNWLYAADAVGRDGPQEEVPEWDWDSSIPNRWRPSIHMPRAASRITLAIKEVWVERLNQISRDDAISEGLFLNKNRWECGNGLVGQSSPEDAYCDLWESINGPGSWDENPWVWAIEFEMV